MAGGGGVVIVGAGWAVYRFRAERKDRAKGEKPAAQTITQNVDGNAQASGPGAIYQGPITFNNPDPAAVVAPIIEDMRRLSAQQEVLAAQIAREKGVPVATLRAILEKMGETGVGEEEIPRILAAKAEELVRLRGEVETIGKAFPDLGAIALEAQRLIDAGSLDAAHDALTQGREAARRRRQDAARAEANLLALDARVNDLKLAYRPAAAKYAEAASLVAGFDAAARFEFLRRQEDELYRRGLEFGDNPALVEAIGVAREALAAAQNADQRGAARNALGNALGMLGERESGTARLEEAVAAYRAALEECTRARAPYDWAQTQQNLAMTYEALFKKTQDKAWLERALVAVDGALEEYRKAEATSYVATATALRERILKAKGG